MLVGEGIRDTVGVMARATTAMAREKISVEMVVLDYFEISVVFLMRHYENNVQFQLYTGNFSKMNQSIRRTNKYD